MNRFALSISLPAAALLALAGTPAQATNFIGDEMRASWRLPTETSLFAFNMNPSKVFTIGAGVEGLAELNATRFLVDFSANMLTFTFVTAGNFSNNAFNGIYFEELGDQSFGAVEAVSGIAADRIHNMGSALSVNFTGRHYAAGETVTISFVPDVPEPASWAMMIAGLGIVGHALRRQRRALPYQFA